MSFDQAKEAQQSQRLFVAVLKYRGFLIDSVSFVLMTIVYCLKGSPNNFNVVSNHKRI